ncbi:phage tail domain-containing protein [Latilactobacillus sp. 5-91]|uniref:phage tail domain-containing protein n=1 Tax=Latilactobacillus sp. 5-91 TaxID=3410924 RepID=UPI003C788EF6
MDWQPATQPKLLIKWGSAPEIDISEQIQGLTFLGDDNNPEITNNYQTNVPTDGSLLMSQSYDKSVINANFWLHFGDYYDLKLAKHDIYRIFNQKGYFRIRTDAEMGIVKFATAAKFEIKPIEDGAHDALFTIPFENPSGYKYSLARSDNLYNYDSELWQVGMNLPNGEDLNYQFKNNRFKVYNASDIPIDPYFQKHDLKIISHFSGSSLKITNLTNGSSWQYQKPATASDSIILDGVRTTLNGQPASVNTDFGNLTLEVGWNDIAVEGATAMDITFSFPFIYLE